MKFLHLSDLHLGKRVNKKDMKEDQEFVLRQILDMAKEVDAVVIAGDVYDKTVPNEEAVELFDGFLSELCELGVCVLIISGNHDSAERLGFGRRIMKNSNVHICTSYKGEVECVKVGDVDFYLLPFIKPSLVRRYFDVEIEDYTHMMSLVLGGIKPEGKSVLVAHQFVTSKNMETERCDSETISVGGLDNVDSSVFDAFEYVALGHIHGSQKLGSDNIRYCGSPLKYSFSEVHHKKSVLLVDMENGLEVVKKELVPLHDMREIKGRLSDLTDESVYSVCDTNDYIHATLTDDEELIDPIGRLRSIYPNIMLLDFDNSRTRLSGSASLKSHVENKSSYELFEEFYQMQNGTQMTEEMQNIVKEMLEV